MFGRWRNRKPLDTNAYADAVPYTKAMYYAELVDAWRLVPRSILIAYGMMVYWVVSWFLAMPNPTTQQAALVTTVTGTVAAVIGLYQHTGRKWGAHNTIKPVTARAMPIVSTNPMSQQGGGRAYTRGGTMSPGANYGDE